MAKAGRKSKYETHIKANWDFIAGCLRSGYTEKSIGKRLGVGHTSWHSYKNKHPEFADHVKTATQDSTALIVNQLYKRAAGYDYEEVHKEVKKGLKGKIIEKKDKTITKHIPPDVGAIAIILFNRDPDKWKHKQFAQGNGEAQPETKIIRMPFSKRLREPEK